MNRRPNFFQLLAWLCGGLILLFVLAPLLGMVLHTTFPTLRETLADGDVLRSVRLTLLASFLATALFSLAAVPFAWVLARKEFPGKAILLGVLDMPVVIPHTTAGIALLSVLNRDSILGQMAERLGFSFIGHPVGIGLCMAFVSMPFLLGAAREGFQSVPERLEKSALTLGASPARVFLTISLPLAKRSVLSGFVMMFARGLSEFGAVIVVAYHPMVAPVLIYDRFTTFGLAPARGAALVFLAIVLVVFVAMRVWAGKDRHAAD